MGHIFIGVICYMAGIFIFFAIMIPMVNFAVWLSMEKFEGSWIGMIFGWTISIWAVGLGAGGAIWFMFFIENLLK